MKLKLNPTKTKKTRMKEDQETEREKTVRFAISAQNVQKALQHWKWRLLNMRLKDAVTRLSALALAALAGSSPAVHATEVPVSDKTDGYFLSLEQKAELIAKGTITGANGTMYDVRVVPGYKPAAEFGRESLEEAGTLLAALPDKHQQSLEAAGGHLKAAGDKFALYGGTELYSTVADCYREGTGTIVNDMGRTLIVKGITDTWTESISHATETTRNQVVGWQLAYPWAVTKSTVESAGRVALGTVGMAGTAAGQYALLPVAHLTAPAAYGTVEGVGAGVAWPTVEITGRTAASALGSAILALGGGVAIPATAAAWNTAVAPPLALVGRMPNEERADGYFVTIMPQETPNAETETDTDAARELSQLTGELESPPATETVEAGTTQSEGGCCAIFNEFFRQQMAWAAIEARASVPQ